MPDTIDYGPGASYPPSMEARVAVLEQIAKSTAATLERIERRLDRLDERIDRLDMRITADFRWLLGIMLGGFAGLLGVMAHGFHWY